MLDQRQSQLLVYIVLLFFISYAGFDAIAVENGENNGFYGIPWGSKLADVSTLKLVEATQRIEIYEPKEGQVQLGEAKANMRLVTIDGQFARTSIRYSGETNHRHMLAYLQSRFGAIERSPGSMIRGLNQQYTWRTEETEVNLTYLSYQERGSVFIESRTLAARFSDLLPDNSP